MLDSNLLFEDWDNVGIVELENVETEDILWVELYVDEQELVHQCFISRRLAS